MSKESRREFEKIKRQKGFHDQFGGKDSEKEVHHKKMLQDGGTNDFSNLIYLYAFWHRFFHKLFDRGETEQVNWKGKNPSVEKQVDSISEACLKNTQKKMYIEDVTKEMKSR